MSLLNHDSFPLNCQTIAQHQITLSKYLTPWRIGGSDCQYLIPVAGRLIVDTLCKFISSCHHHFISMNNRFGDSWRWNCRIKIAQELLAAHKFYASFKQNTELITAESIYGHVFHESKNHRHAINTGIATTFEMTFTYLHFLLSRQHKIAH